MPLSSGGLPSRPGFSAPPISRQIFTVAILSYFTFCITPADAQSFTYEYIGTSFDVPTCQTFNQHPGLGSSTCESGNITAVISVHGVPVGFTGFVSDVSNITDSFTMTDNAGHVIDSSTPNGCITGHLGFVHGSIKSWSLVGYILANPADTCGQQQNSGVLIFLSTTSVQTSTSNVYTTIQFYDRASNGSYPCDQGYSLNPGQWYGGAGLCPTPNTAITNVVLPAVTVSSPPLLKPYRISYGQLSLAFQVDFDPTVTCEAHATAVLPVYFNSQPGTTLGANIFASQATVVLTVFDQGTTGTIQPCAFSLFGGINNDCLLNGPYDSTATYLRWSTRGFNTFAVTPFGNVPTGLGTGPLTFWVNLDSLGVSSNTNVMDTIVRTAEPYIHRTLINNLPELPGAIYTIIQDPGSVNLAVINANGLTSGTLPNGVATFDIPLSFVFPSSTNPAVILGNLGVGTYLVVLTGTFTGDYQLAITTQIGMTSSQQASITGTLARGASVGYRLTITSSVGGAIATISPAPLIPGDLNGDGTVDCSDIDIVKSSFGKSVAQSGFNAWADINQDNVIDIRDLAFVARQIRPGTVCQ